MSERLNNAQEVRNVDQAFDPKARTAQNDWNEYRSSRPYQDSKGSLHDAENGQFIANSNESYDIEAIDSDTANFETNRAKKDAEDYYDQMHTNAESGVDTRFHDKSLKEIAEMVSEAREAGDKTLESDARAAFDDNFMEMAEKYDWQGVTENADGTTTDRNAIADRKLAYYESIMNGEGASSEPGTTDDKAEYIPKHRAENRDEESPLFDEVAHEQGADDAVARENESQEEYEARQPGRHRAEPLPTDDLDTIASGAEPNGEEPLPTDELDAIANGDDETTPRSRRERVSDWLRHPITTASAEVTARQINRRYERENGNDTRTRRRRLLGGFVLFGGAIAGGLLLMKGHDIFSHSHGGGGGTGPQGSDGFSGMGPLGAPGAEHAPDVVKPIADTVRVNPGDGEIKVLQHVLANNGLKVDTTQAQQIGEHAGLHDILSGDHSYGHSGSTMDRIGETGKFRVRGGVVAKALRAAKELGYK